MAAPYDYDDLQEESIRSLEALNNKHDPSGKLNDLRLPPYRMRQQASRPKFYDPSQHSLINLDVPYQFRINLHHHVNPAGNPQNRPVTLSWKDTALDEISDTDISPWIFLHHAGEHPKESSKLKELDDGNNGPGFAQSNESEEPPEILETNGFFSLAVDETKVVRVEFKYTGDGLQLERGQDYSFGFRGSRVHWWKWGSLDELKGQRKEESTGESGFITIPASNLIEVHASTLP
ncbi:MAG: hypothetical protein Q9195_004994 [Heterodermia aff. obscurata]